MSNEDSTDGVSDPTMGGADSHCPKCDTCQSPGIDKCAICGYQRSVANVVVVSGNSADVTPAGLPSGAEHDTFVAQSSSGVGVPSSSAGAGRARRILAVVGVAVVVCSVAVFAARSPDGSGDRVATGTSLSGPEPSTNSPEDDEASTITGDGTVTTGISTGDSGGSTTPDGSGGVVGGGGSSTEDSGGGGGGHGSVSGGGGGTGAIGSSPPPTAGSVAPGTSLPPPPTTSSTVPARTQRLLTDRT